MSLAFNEPAWFSRAFKTQTHAHTHCRGHALISQEKQLKIAVIAHLGKLRHIVAVRLVVDKLPHVVHF